MPAHRLMPTVQWMAIVAALGHGPVEAAELHERVVARVPVCPAPQQVSDRECGAQEEHCSAGFIFSGARDTLYFYDLFHDNLKVVNAFGGPGVARVLPGLPRRDRHARLVDGAQGPDGALYLRTSTGGSHPRERIWRFASDGRWQPADRAIRWQQVSGGAARPALGPQRGVPIDARAVRSRDRHRRPWLRSNELVDAQTHTPGLLMGVDHYGNRWTMAS